MNDVISRQRETYWEPGEGSQINYKVWHLNYVRDSIEIWYIDSGVAYWQKLPSYWELV